MTRVKKDKYSIITIDEERVIAEKAMQAKHDFISILQEENLQEHWIVDMSNIKYIDSSGLGAFLTLYRLVRDQGRYLYFIGVQKHVEKLLHIAKLDNIFDIYSSVEEVVETKIL